MSENQDRPTVGVLPPMGTGGGFSVGVAAPVGAVSRKDRERAARTALRREGDAGVVLHTELSGSVTLERRADDGAWEAVRKVTVARTTDTRLDLPTSSAEAGGAVDAGGAAPPQSFRVVFVPKNPDITAWVSEAVEG